MIELMKPFTETFRVIAPRGLDAKEVAMSGILPKRFDLHHDPRRNAAVTRIEVRRDSSWPVWWNITWLIEDAPEELRPAIEQLSRVVAQARVTGIFLCSDPV